MSGFNKAMIKLLEEKEFVFTDPNDIKMQPLIKEEVYKFITNLHEIIQDFTEDKPLSNVLARYTVRELVCQIHNINNPNDLT